MSKLVKSSRYLYGLGRIEKPLKTEAGLREVDLPVSVISLFKDLRKQQMENRLFMAEKYEENNLVFCQENGKPIDPANLTCRFRRQANLAGIRPSINNLGYSRPFPEE